MDISTTKIREYIESQVKPNFREYVANAICDGEKLVNSISSPEGESLVNILSEHIDKEIRALLNLIVAKKYDDNEELRRIREHCIAIDRIMDVVKHWTVKLNELDRHLSKMNDEGR